jgi:choline dehydrogenase
MPVSRCHDLVVGGGSAGSALAARLSEDPARRVGLIEAGPYYPTPDDMPADLLNGNAMSLATHDWGMQAQIFEGRRIRFPQGRVAGGSSAVGMTIAVRGMPGDYDAWAAAGNPEWAWDCVLPFFKAVETDLDFNDEFHGQHGPIPIRRWRSGELTAVQEAFLASCLEAGFPYNADQNHPESTGVGPIPSNRCNPTTRVSAAMGYLTPARDRANLTVHQRARAGRVLLRDGRAIGVELVSPDGSLEEVFAGRVILTAGAFHSPAILMRSGIGPAAELRTHGIEPLVELDGVGSGLLDHPRSGVFMTPREHNQSLGAPLGQIMLRTTSGDGGEVNDMQYYGVSHLDLTEQFPELRSQTTGSRIFGAMVVGQLPRSAGRLTLASADPLAPPVIDLNYFDDDDDAQTMMAGLRTCWQLVQCSKLRDLSDQVVGLSESSVADDEALGRYLRLTADSTYHPIGTARMGPARDTDSVVDQYGAVHGTESLYVADASVMPTMPRGNTNLTTMMIAERVASWLRSA